MRQIIIVLLSCVPVIAAVNGVVINRTTGKPQPGATVVFNKFGQGGMEPIGEVKTDAQGKFTIDQEAAQGPHLIRTEWDGITYNHMMPPGSATANLTLEVYNSSKQPGGAKVSKHMILFEPSGGQVVVNETYLFENSGPATWNDPVNGTLRFYLPAGANGKVEINATAPEGMPISAPVTKTSLADIYKVDFPIKPGETRFDLTYSAPYQPGSEYSGKVVTADDNTYLIAPAGVTLKADNLTDLGQEPRTQAHIFGLKANTYNIQLTGGEADTSAGPQIEQILPRINGQAKTILAISLGILALGFVLLYRKETNERGRR